MNIKRFFQWRDFLVSTVVFDRNVLFLIKYFKSGMLIQARVMRSKMDMDF